MCHLAWYVLVCIVVASQIAASQTIDESPRPSCTGSVSLINVNQPEPTQFAKWSATDFSMNCLGTVIADTSSALIKNRCTNMTANNMSLSSTSGAAVYLQTGSGSSAISYPLALMAGSVTQLSYQFDAQLEVSFFVVAPALEHLPGCTVGFKLDGTLHYVSTSESRSNVRPFLVHSTDNIIIKSDEVTFYFAVPHTINGTFEGLGAAVPTTSDCGSDAGTAFILDTSNLTMITALPVVSWSHTFPVGGRYSLCTNFNGDGWAVAATVVVYGNPAYFIIHGSGGGDVVYMYQEYTISFVGENFDLRPQGDRFKLVSVLDGCSDSASAGGGMQVQSDLGPDDSYINVSHSTALLKITIPGAFLVCYFLNSESRWSTVENYDTLPHEAADYLPSVPTTTVVPISTIVSETPSTFATSVVGETTATTAEGESCTEVVNCPIISTTNPLLVLTLDSYWQYDVESSLEFRRGMDALLCVDNGSTPSSIIWEVRSEGDQSQIVLGYSCGTVSSCSTALSLSHLKCKLEEGIAKRKYISNVISVYTIASAGVTSETSSQGSSSTNPETTDIMIISGVVAGMLLLGLLIGGTVYFFIRADPPRQSRHVQTGAVNQDDYQVIHPVDGDIPVGIEMAEVESVSDVEREPEWGRGATYQPNMAPADFAAEKRAAAESSRLATNNNDTLTPTLTSSKSSTDRIDSMDAGSMPFVNSPNQVVDTLKSEELES